MLFPVDERKHLERIAWKVALNFVPITGGKPSF
jgi:hypothetical protein